MKEVEKIKKGNFFQKLLVQVAFFVKHEMVGGQVEVLARTTFQIPDLVAACRWVNMTCWMKYPFFDLAKNYHLMVW